jgi:ABC-2 type transport system permease protein
MKMLTGHLRADAGAALIAGLDVAEEAVRAKQHLGYSPEGAPAYGEMTVREFLRFAADLRGLADPAASVRRTLALCRLEEVAAQGIDTLSKGYRMRVGFAQAVLHDPEVLILDEPTDGLDPNQKHEVRRILKEMAATKAVIVSTHILEEVGEGRSPLRRVPREVPRPRRRPQRRLPSAHRLNLSPMTSPAPAAPGLKPFAAMLRREFAGYFRTPLAYVFLAVFNAFAVSLAFFVGGLYESGVASLDRFFLYHPWLWAFLAPAAGARLWAEERRQGTLELLLTWPITVWQAALGKFLAAWLFLACALLMTLPVAFTVGWLGDPDWGVIVSGYAGSLLCAGACLGVAAVASALTRSQVIAFVTGFLACFLLVLVGYGVFDELLAGLFGPAGIDEIRRLGLWRNLEPFTLGLLDVRPIAYFLSVAFAGLGLSTIIIERR